MENKPFFTKYIAVEGEIKDGQVIMSRDGSRSINNNIKDISPEMRTKANSLGYKAGSLFLCSRDILPEDYANENVQVHIYHDGSEPPFKVIGEVSPEVTWVTEGMTFSEEEIEEWWGQAITHYPMIKKLHADTWGFKELSENCPIVYKIKGPCGHFH